VVGIHRATHNHNIAGAYSGHLSSVVTFNSNTEV